MVEDSMGPRWKGKGSEAKAIGDPMSKIVSQLQSSLTQSDSQGLLSGHSVLLDVNTEQADLLNRACFGRPIITAEKGKQWFQLGMEEAFYLCHTLNCLKIVSEDNFTKNDENLWNYMKSNRERFPDFFKAYCHLRRKNWVVRSGSQYGVDFVIYRHHPALVHSEYAVLVLSEGDGNGNDRLRVWSDFQCTLRLCGSVAKTLLVLEVCKNEIGDASPSCLDCYSVEERTITRWSPEQCREDPQLAAKVTNFPDIFVVLGVCSDFARSCGVACLQSCVLAGLTLITVSAEVWAVDLSLPVFMSGLSHFWVFFSGGAFGIP